MLQLEYEKGRDTKGMKFLKIIFHIVAFSRRWEAIYPVCIIEAKQSIIKQIYGKNSMLYMIMSCLMMSSMPSKYD